jgi:hypothetical protein
MFSGHVAAARGQTLSVFVSSISLTNILLYSSIARNIKYYIHHHYVSRLFRWLTKEYSTFIGFIGTFVGCIVDSCSA